MHPTAKYFLLLLLVVSIHATAQEVGMASYYHDYFQGKRTASGELYDQRKMTAAHKSLPIGTLVKVTNLENEKSVIVRINDRGPYVRTRVIDLSKLAAIQLGFVQKGSTQVSVEVLDDGGASRDSITPPLPENLFYSLAVIDTATRLLYAVKVGSYEDATYILNMAASIPSRFGCSVYIQSINLTRGKLYRIFAGNYATVIEAETLHRRLLVQYPDCKVVPYKEFR